MLKEKKKNVVVKKKKNEGKKKKKIRGKLTTIRKSKRTVTFHS